MRLKGVNTRAGTKADTAMARHDRYLEHNKNKMQGLNYVDHAVMRLLRSPDYLQPVLYDIENQTRLTLKPSPGGDREADGCKEQDSQSRRGRDHQLKIETWARRGGLKWAWGTNSDEALRDRLRL